MYHEAPSLAPTVVRDLELLAPSGGHLSWLHCTWRPDWERWCIWQMVPAHGAPAMAWGPDMRMVTRAESALGKRTIRMAPDPRYRLFLNRELMTRWAWQIHIATGHYPTPFWVVQGSEGGHKWAFSQQEEKLAKIKGFSGDPPEPGSLPYAPLDKRVIAKIAPFDQLPLWNVMSRAFHEMDERDLDQRENDMLVAANTQLWNWMDSQVDKTVEESGLASAGDPGAGYRDADADYEGLHEQFIHSID